MYILVIECLHKIVQEKLTLEVFNEYMRDYELDREKYLNDFESLRYLRRFFRKKRSFEIGVIVFETLLQQNITNKEYVLINLAYLYDELGNIEKANESIKQALSTASNQEFIIDKAGNFFLQIAEKGHANPLERAKSVFQSSLTDQNFTIAINDQIANIEITYNFYDKFNKLIRDLGQGFLSKARNEKQIVLSQLATLLNEMKYLLESKKITLNTSILGDINKGKTTKILKQIEKESVKQNDYELSNLCKIITIKINEIFIVQNGLDSISNFSNYYEIASILNEAKKQNFHLDINAEKYYEDYETYIRKAIDFGEETLKNLTHNTELKPHYNSIPNAYILYGYFRIESALKDYGQAVELSNKARAFTSVSNLVYIAYQLFTEKVNLPSEFLSEKKDIFDLLENNKIIETLEKSKSNPEDVRITHTERLILSEDSSKLFVSRILKNAERLLSYLEALIDRFKQLSIDEHDITFLERTIKPALNIAKQEFCKQKINELSIKCSLLILKCAEVLLTTKNTTDSIANAYRLCGNIKIELAIGDYQRAFAILHSYNFKNIASESIPLNSISQYIENKFDSTSEILFLILGLLVFEHLNENIKDKYHIQNCIRRIFVKFYKYLGRDDKAAIYEGPYIQLINLTKNDQEYFTNILRSQDETIPKVKKLLDEINKLVENSKIPINHIFFDKVIKYVIRKASEEFRKQKNYELFCKCTLLEIKCAEIFIASKSRNDSSNFNNYYDILNILSSAKKHGLDLFPDAEKYYELTYYKELIGKTIEHGEKEIEKLSLQERLDMKTYSFLADAYRLRGKIKLEGDNKDLILSAQEDFQRAVKLFVFIGDLIYQEEYLGRNVERLAECYLHLKDYENAINEYKILFDKSKEKKYQAALKLGDIYDEIDNFHFHEAKEFYLKCLEISKEDLAAYDKLVHLHRNHGYYDKAIEWQRILINLKCIQLSKKQLDYQYFRLGIMYEEKGAIRDSIDIFRHIVKERQPDSLTSLDRLISLLILREEYPEAIEWLKKKLEIEINISSSPLWDYCRLGDCYIANSKDKALEYYEKALSINPESIAALQRLAKWYELNAQYKDAINILNKMIFIVSSKQNEQADGLYKWIGDLFRNLEDKLSALDAYYKSLEIKPHQYEIYDRIEQITKNRFQSSFEKIDKLENEYKNLPSPDLAARIINLSLSTHNKEYARKVCQYLDKSIYKPGGFEYFDKLALAYETECSFDLAIKKRQEIDNFETLDIKQKLKNLRKLVELIKQNKLHKYKNIGKSYINKIEDLIKENIPTIDKRIEGAVSEDNVSIQMMEDETNIYTLRDELYFLAIYYKEIGSREKAHTYIRKLLGSSLYELQNDKVYLQAEADIFYEERKLDEAQKVLNKIKGEDSYALMLLGKIKKCKKEFQSAIEYFKRAYKSSGEIFPADQIGATYREWAEELTLTEQERFEIKNKAIEWYQILSEKYQDDKIIRFGLAKSYLLKPLGKEHIQDGVRIISNIIKSGIDSKSYITRNDIDKRSIRELLSLWSKNYDDTIKRIILGKNKLTTNEYNHNLIIEESINIAKEQNIFELDAVNTFKIIFIENRNKRVRNAICKYFMKFVICECFKSNNLQDIQNTIKGVIRIVLETSDTNELLEYLAEFLGSEKGAYLEFLVKEIYPDIKYVEDTIIALNENNCVDTANELRSGIASVKKRLESIEFISINKELANIKKEFENRQDFYRTSIGSFIDFSVKLGLEETYCSQAIWDNIDDFVNNTLTIFNSELHLSGSCTLRVKRSDQDESLLINIEFLDAQQESWHQVVKDIKKSYEGEGLNVLVNEVHNGFIVQKEFKIEDKKISTIFKSLYDFIITTYAAFGKTHYWQDIYAIVKNEIKLNSPNIQEEIVNQLLLQISTLFKRSKNLIFVFLNEPHDLKHLCTRDDIPHEERITRINRIKENIREISFFTRGFHSKETKEEFSIRDIILNIKKEFEGSQVRDNLFVKIDLGFQEDDGFNLIGIPGDIEAIIKNLFHNAYGAIKKNNFSDKQKPEIKITLKRKDNEYEILFSDNGIGIPEGKNVSDLINESMQNIQVDAKTKSGVGLLLMTTIVNKYQGYFDIDKSATGENSGTTFLIKLPITYS